MTRKGTRLIVIVAVALLVLFAAAAFFINLYRDSIALEVARTALRDSGIQVSDVSVESISAEEVRFEAIVLELPDGGTILIDGITLPVRFLGFRNSTLHAESLRFLPGMADAGPTRFAVGLQTFLDAPAATPGATIRIDEVLLSNMPVIRDLAWHADQLNPTLRATVHTFELFVTTMQDSDDAFRGSVRALLPDNTEAVMLGFQLVPDQSGIEIRGNINLALAPLLPVLHAIGAVPAEVTTLSSTLNGAFELRLEADATLPVEVQAIFDTAAGTNVTYRTEDAHIEVAVIATAPVTAVFEYPSLDWTARIARSSLSIAGIGPELPVVHLRGSECRSGIACRTALEFSYDEFAIGELKIDGAAVTAGAVQFESRDDKWTVSSPDTQIALDKPALAGRRVIAPDIDADVSGSNERVSATVDFGTTEGGLMGHAALSHNLATGSGELTLESAAIEFNALNLSGIFTDWPYDWDVTAGRGEAESDIHWTSTDEGFAYEGTAAVNADALAGRYADIGFVGLSSSLDIALNSRTPVSLKPARFDVALVDIGFPVENISGTATPYFDESAVGVSDLSMSVLGGTVTADPFRYELDAESNQLTLRADGIQLPLMAGLADLEAVTISGSVSGEIPVFIRGSKVIIDGGRLENDPPGGVIRYRGGAADAVVDDASQLGIVTRTLRNFEFDSLTSAVNYSQDGDLVLRMRLKGINPDVDPTQPVILNLNVENNVPQMLRSLQATRSIEDVLEKRLSK
jgi:hypothetical protein